MAHAAHAVTTSIRLPNKLREELEHVSHSMHRGKNWIITKALEEYLAKQNRGSLAKEARRQSLLASKSTRKVESNIWEDHSDTSGWK